MIDPNTETLLSLTEAAKHLPRRRRQEAARVVHLPLDHVRLPRHRPGINSGRRHALHFT